MKDVSIRKYIIDNFKGDNESEIEESINDTIKEGLEEALPGLGVFMELIWKNAKDELNYVIKEKDKFYQSIRKHRNEAKN